MVFAFLKTDNRGLFTQLRRHGFKATLDLHWKLLLDAIELLDSHQLIRFKVRKKIKQLRESGDKAQTLDSVKALWQFTQLITPKYLAWQKQQVELFNDPKWWEARLASADTHENAKQTIQFLQQVWKQQSHYALYSTLDLLHVYETVFPLFYEWWVYAETELQKKKHYLPEKILRNYQDYLKNFAKSLAYEKQQVRMALKSRLVAGLTQQNAQFDDVISMLQQDLQSLGVLSNPKPSPNEDYPGYLTPDVWLKMQQIIERDGNDNEKLDWYSLAYNTHRNPDNNPLFYKNYRSTQEGDTYRIPSKLAPQIPTKIPFYLKLPEFLHWFFTPYQLYYTFFQHPACQYLLAIEQSFEQWQCPAEVNLINLEKHQSWQGLQHLWAHLASEEVRIQTTKKDLFILFQEKVTPLFEGYHHHLHQLAHEILSKQIQMLNRALESFKQKAMAEDEKKQLQQVLQQLQETAKCWKSTSDLNSQLSMLVLNGHHLTHQPVITPEILATATTAIDQLTQGETVTSEALNTINTAQSSIALGQCVDEKNSYTQTRFAIESYLAKEKIPDLLKAELLENPLNFDQDKLTIHLEKLKTYHTWIYREKQPLMDPVILNDQLCHYAYAFLKSVHALPSKDAFLEKACVIQQVIRTLQYLTETTFPALHRTLLSVAKIDINQPIYSNHWELFRKFELAPPLNTLKKYLTGRGLTAHLQDDVKAEPATKNPHAFKKVFSPAKKATNQTETVSLQSTLTH